MPDRSEEHENLPSVAKTDGSAVDDEGSDNQSFRLAIFDDCLRSVPLDDGTLLIGRSKLNHLQLHDDLLSRKHCTLTTCGEKLTLVDLNSSNGTYVNGQRIGSRDLEIDDIIELGKTVLVVFDGTCWRRGRGMMNLRNPIKAQELVQRLTNGGTGLSKSEKAPPQGPPRNGVRRRKGLSDHETAFLHWLEGGESRLLPDMVASYLNHKLVSLLVRNSKPIRAAFTSVLEGMMRPELFQRVGTMEELREAISQMVARELQDLRSLDAEPDELDHELERELLEPQLAAPDVEAPEPSTVDVDPELEISRDQTPPQV